MSARGLALSGPRGEWAIHPQGTVTKSETPPRALHECALCGQRRAHGGLLRVSDTNDAHELWVCEDCQHQLILQVDDHVEGR